MQIGYISDIHADHWGENLESPSVLDSDDLDLLINCGDHLNGSNPFSKSDRRCSILNKKLLRHHAFCRDTPTINVVGNHNLYGSTLCSRTNIYREVIRDFHGMTIVNTPLFPDLYNSPNRKVIKRFINCFSQIKDYTPENLSIQHDICVKFIKQNKPEIVATHWAPFQQSIHPKYAGNPLNDYFACNLNPKDFPFVKYWFHGHTHSDMDYTVDGIRVLCNPVGYRGENMDHFDPKIKILNL